MKLYGAADIGGTKIAVGIVSGNKVVDSRTFPTDPENGIENTAIKISTVLNELSCGNKLSGIGIGSTGPINPITGIYGDAYNLPGWQGKSITKILKNISGIPVAAENDLNAALLGEIILSELYNKDILLMMCGTGVGISFYKDGALYRTRLPHHPEMGHLLVMPDGPECVCGQHGCIESLLSGTALNQIAQNSGFTDFDDLCIKAKSDETAKSIITNTRHAFQTAIWNLTILFQPDIVLLGGGIIKAHFELFKEFLSDVPWHKDAAAPFKLAPLSHQDASLVGAASLVELRPVNGSTYWSEMNNDYGLPF